MAKLRHELHLQEAVADAAKKDLERFMDANTRSLETIRHLQNELQSYKTQVDIGRTQIERLSSMVAKQPDSLLTSAANLFGWK